MRYYSTRNKSKSVSLGEAVINGLAPDGGLYLPGEIPRLPGSFFADMSEKSLIDIGFSIAREYCGEEIPEEKLSVIINDALNFDAPVRHLFENFHVLELFHGPTLAFKDFGARFMARLLGYFVRDKKQELHILVATSGDTGSAVANGFFGVDGIKVHLLYPSGRVSELQEKQLTTYGGNITALEVEGSFDDCQRMVKNAFESKGISNSINISSANSINIARLLPQSFYYFYAAAQFRSMDEIVFSVPSGNLGNLTAGILAKKMGLPVKGFISATNKNDIFTEYINKSVFNPRESVKTISNAMDVGNPSNFERLLQIYGGSHASMKEDISSSTFSDRITLEAMKEVYEKCGYLIDPHGAVGYLAAKASGTKNNVIILETAHPAKFNDSVKVATGKEAELPERLASCLHKKKKSVKISGNFEEFKSYLLDL